MNAFNDALMKIGPMRLFAALGITAVVAAALFALVFRVGGEEKALLFSDVEMAEAAEITAKLETANIPYELRGDGTTIFVPRSKVMSARLMLSEDGLPSRGGIGYEIFDKQDALGATQFQQNINRLRALEGELARTIASIEGVERARVHLVLPERQLFTQERQAPSASIVVTVKGGQLAQGQVRAVRNLVASAVPGLSVNRVTIADASGKLLAAAEEDGGAAAADAMDERKAAIEERLRREVQGIVESIVGPGAARVQVAADVDFNRVTSTAQTFDPEGRVVRETNSTEETTSSGGGDAGAATAGRNLPDGASADGAGGGGESSERTEEQVRYEISSTTKTEVVEGGRIKRLSVAVAVDGVTAPGADGKPGEWAARDPQELERITALVKSAVGFDEARGDKVEVVNLKFAQSAATAGTEAAKPSMFDFGKNDIMRGVEILAALIASLGVVFFVLRPLVTGMLGGGATGGGTLLAGPGGTPALAGVGAGAGAAALAPPVAGALPAPAGGLLGGMEHQLDIAKIQGQVNSSSVKRVAEVIEQHPEESAQILRAWLSERS